MVSIHKQATGSYCVAAGNRARYVGKIILRKDKAVNEFEAFKRAFPRECGVRLSAVCPPPAASPSEDAAAILNA